MEKNNGTTISYGSKAKNVMTKITVQNIEVNVIKVNG